jgi:hypothetical protein
MFLQFDTQSVGYHFMVDTHHFFEKNHDKPWFGFELLIDTHPTPILA